MKKLKTRKWYSTATTKPDRRENLIIMTDMGYVFEAVYKDEMFHTSVLRNNKVYFELHFSPESIIRFMKI